MNFRKATDELTTSITLEDLATALGVSVQAVRQARAQEGSAGFRRPPQGWERAVVKLVEARAHHYQRFAAKLRSSLE